MHDRILLCTNKTDVTFVTVCVFINMDYFCTRREQDAVGILCYATFSSLHRYYEIIIANSKENAMTNIDACNRQ